MSLYSGNDRGKKCERKAKVAIHGQYQEVSISEVVRLAEDISVWCQPGYGIR